MKSTQITALALTILTTTALELNAADTTEPTPREIDHAVFRQMMTSTEMIQLRKELREAEKDYRKAVDTIPEIIRMDAEIQTLMKQMHELRKQRRDTEKKHAPQLADKKAAKEQLREHISIRMRQIHRRTESSSSGLAQSETQTPEKEK